MTYKESVLNAMQGKSIPYKSETKATLNEMLDKLTPMSPVIDNVPVHFPNYHIGQCPKCKFFVQSNDNYCHDCGQALDWGN